MIVRVVLAVRVHVQLPQLIPVRLVSLFRVIPREVQALLTVTLHRRFVAVRVLLTVALLHLFVVAAVQVLHVAAVQAAWVAQAVPVRVPAVQEDHLLQVVDNVIDYNERITK